MLIFGGVLVLGARKRTFGEPCCAFHFGVKTVQSTENNQPLILGHQAFRNCISYIYCKPLSSIIYIRIYRVTITIIITFIYHKSYMIVIYHNKCKYYSNFKCQTSYITDQILIIIIIIIIISSSSSSWFSLTASPNRHPPQFHGTAKKSERTVASEKLTPGFLAGNKKDKRSRSAAVT